MIPQFSIPLHQMESYPQMESKLYKKILVGIILVT